MKDRVTAPRRKKEETESTLISSAQPNLIPLPGLSNPVIFQDLSGFHQEGLRTLTILKILNKPIAGHFSASCKPFSQEGAGRLAQTVYS